VPHKVSCTVRPQTNAFCAGSIRMRGRLRAAARGRESAQRQRLFFQAWVRGLIVSDSRHRGRPANRREIDHRRLRLRRENRGEGAATSTRTGCAGDVGRMGGAELADFRSQIVALRPSGIVGEPARVS